MDTADQRPATAPRPSGPVAAPARGDTRLLTRPFVLLMVSDLAYFTAMSLMIPLVPLYAAGELGAGAAGVGIAVGAYAVVALVLRPVAGWQSDRWGRRPLLVGGALLAAVAVGAQGFADQLTVLIAMRLLLGVADGMFFVATFAALADVAPAGRTGEALSFGSLALYLGIAGGPLLGETLLGVGGFDLAWAAAAGLMLAAAAAAVGVGEPGTPRPDAPWQGFVHRTALGPGLLLAAGIGGMTGFFAFVALYSRELGLADSGTVMLVFGGIVVGLRVVFAKLPDRVPPMPLTAVSLTLCALGLVTVSTVGSVAGLFAGTAVLAVGVAFLTPAVFAAVYSRVPPAERGSAAGTTTLCVDIAFGGGPMVFGVVAAAGGIPAAYAAAGLVAGIAAAAAAVSRRFRPAVSAAQHA